MLEDFIREFLLYFFKSEVVTIHIDSDPIDYDSIILNKNDKEIIIDCEQDNFFNGHKYYIRCGISKIVFVFDDFDEVIKIPFNGEYYHSYYKGDVVNTYYNDFNNYIEIENKIYQQSDEYLKEILLDNKFVFNFGQIPVYIQTKIFQTFFEKIYDKDDFKLKDDNLLKQLNKLILKRDSILNKNTMPDKRFLIDILNYYKDAEFIIPRINFEDMHDSNYGYLKNGQPIIFDFSGFSDY